MNCREARADVALYAGGDLDDRARVRELRQHVAGCPECRDHYQSLKSTLKTLAGLAPLETGGSTWQRAGGLWPAIRHEIARPPRPFTAATAFNQLRPWAPLAVMTAACVLMLVSLGQFGTPPEEPVTRGVVAPPSPMALQTQHSEPNPPAGHSESRGLPPFSADRSGF